MTHSRFLAATLLFICLSTYAQNFNWGIGIGGSQSLPNASEESGRYVMSDASGNIVTVGHFVGTADVDPSASTYNLVGPSNGTSTARNTYIAKYTTDRTLLWARKIDSLSSFSFTDNYMDASGNIYLVGSVVKTTIFDAASGAAGRIVYSTPWHANNYVAKYSSNGTFMWVKNFPGAYKITVDNANNILVCGSIQGTVDLDITASSFTLTPIFTYANYIAKYDANFNLIFAKKIDKSNASVNDPGGIVTDNSNIYVTGVFDGNVDFDPSAAINYISTTSEAVNEPYLTKYDASGNLLWAYRLESNGSNFAISPIVDASGNLYLTGLTSAMTMNFDPAGPGYTLWANASMNTILAKYSPNGNLSWANLISNMAGYGIKASAANIYLHGNAYPNCDVDPSVSVVKNPPFTGDAIVAYNLTNGSLAWVNSIGGKSATVNSVDLHLHGNGSVSCDAQGNVFATSMFLINPGATVDMDPGSNVYNMTVNGYPNDALIVKYSPSNINFSTNKTAYCEGESINITYTSLGNFGAGNQFTFQLSDAAGNFGSPTLITSVTAASGTYVYTVPAGLTESSSYKIRMSASGTPALVLEKIITVSTLPTVSISTGQSNLCEGQPIILNSNAGGTATGRTYQWKKNNTAIAGATQATLMVFNTTPADAGSYTCTVTNTCGSKESNAITFAIRSTSSIAGDADLCAYDVSQTYSVTYNPGSTYTWSTPAGLTIASGQNTNSIGVSVSNYSTTGTISVQEMHVFGCSTTKTLTINALTTPAAPVITGAQNVCGNAGLLNFTTTYTPNSIYTWTQPDGTTINSGQTTSSVHINFESYTISGVLTLNETNGIGCTSLTTTYPITALPVPTTPIVTGASVLCDNAPAATYTVSNTPGSVYQWSRPANTALLSGTGTSSLTFSVSGTITNGTLAVKEINSDGCSSPSSLFTINTTPSPLPADISGSTSVCGNATGKTYSVVNTPGSSYIWGIAGGILIQSGQGTNSISTDFANFVSPGTINVVETNSAGCVGNPGTLSIQPLAVPGTAAIAGKTSVCGNEGTVVYSVANTLNSSYFWSIPSGSDFVSGQGSNSIALGFTSYNTSGQLSVQETNELGCVGSPVLLSVAALPVPQPYNISGALTVCDNASSVSYNVPNNVGSVYQWAVPMNASILNGQGSSNLAVAISGAIANGAIAVIETNSSGCTGSASSLLINTSASPSTTQIAGISSACGNATDVSFSVVSTPGSSYQWAVPSGATVQSGQSSPSIVVNFNNYITTGTISVIETNMAGCIGAARTKTINPLTVPATSAITGPTNVCANATGVVYSVQPTAGSQYLWSFPLGATPVGASTSNQFTLNYSGFPGGSVSVMETNSLGCKGNEMITFVNPLPVPVPSISGPASVCNNATSISYSVSNNAGSSYLWTKPGAASTIVSGQGTSTLAISVAGTISSQPISVTETNSSGCSATAQLLVSSVASPAAVIFTNNFFQNVCSNQTGTSYSVTNRAGSTYAWTTPAGSTLVSGQGTNSITVTYSGFQNTGLVSVVETNAAGCNGPTATQTITAYYQPQTPILAGPNGLCTINQAYNYTVTNPEPNVSYIWTTPANVTKGNYTPYMIYTYNNSFVGDGEITVQAVSNYGCASPVQSFRVSGLISSGIQGPSSLCVGTNTATYTSTPTSGATYAWGIEEAGHSITSGAGTNQIGVALDASSNVNVYLEISTYGCSKTVSTTTFRRVPNQTGFIIGTPIVCPSVTSGSYTIASRVGSTYAWTLPTGISITSGAATNSISVSFAPTVTTSTISVIETNSFGCASSPATFQVKLADPVGSPITASGTQFCSGGTNLLQVTNIRGSYTWSASPGLSIDRPNSFAIVATNNGTFKGTGFISVVEMEGGVCPKPPVTIAVTGMPTINIAGPSTVCSNAQGVVFTADNLPNTTYSWVPIGASTATGSGNQITLGYNNFTSTATITVYTYSTNGGCNSSASKTVTGIAKPATSAIVGPGNICNGMTSATYSVNNTAGSTYNWVVPGGTTIVSGAGTNSITLQISSPSTLAGNLSVTETNAAGCVGTTMNRFLSSSADFTTAITGPVKVCSGAHEVLFQVTETIGSSYQWTLPAGATIVVPTISNPINNGQGKNAIYVNFNGFTGGTISVQETNIAGCVGTIKSLPLGIVTSSYFVPSVSMSCNNPATVDLQLKTTGPISSDVTALALCFSYNPAVITPLPPTTKYTLGSVVTAGGNATVNYNASIPGQINAFIYYTNPSSRMTGSGNVITFHFRLTGTAAPGSVSPITFCGVSEGYGSGGGSVQCINTNATVSIVPDEPLHKGQLQLMANGGISLGYDATNPARYLITNISGSNNNACGGTSASIQPDVNGAFTFDNSNGDYINISRDIAPTTSVFSAINSADAQRIANLLSANATYPPTIAEILAADVDQDGFLSGSEPELILKRSTLEITEFPQMGGVSRDWIFLDNTTYNALNVSMFVGNFTLPDGTKRYVIPNNVQLLVTPPCLKVRKLTSGGCTYSPAEIYKGVLVGDASSANTLTVSQNGMRTTADSIGTIILDIKKAELLSNGNYKMPVQVSSELDIVAIDLNFDYNQNSVSIKSCDKPTSGINEQIVLASNDLNHDQFYVSGYTLESFEPGKPVYYLEIDPVNATLIKSDFGSAIGLLNGVKANVRVLDETDVEENTDTDLSLLRLYPNPTLDKIELSGVTGNISVSILNVQGKEVMKSENTLVLDVSTLSSGMYHLKLTSGNGSRIMKFTKL